MVYKYSQIKSLRLNYSRAPPDRKTQKPNGKKLGTYSPTDAVAQPLGVKGNKSIDRWIKQDIKIKVDSSRAEMNTLQLSKPNIPNNNRRIFADVIVYIFPH